MLLSYDIQPNEHRHCYKAEEHTNHTKHRHQDGHNQRLRCLELLLDLLCIEVNGFVERVESLAGAVLVKSHQHVVVVL
jgi:hypothetical protein